MPPHECSRKHSPPWTLRCCSVPKCHWDCGQPRTAALHKTKTQASAEQSRPASGTGSCTQNRIYKGGGKLEDLPLPGTVVFLCLSIFPWLLTKRHRIKIVDLNSRELPARGIKNSRLCPNRGFPLLGLNMITGWSVSKYLRMCILQRVRVVTERVAAIHSQRENLLKACPGLLLHYEPKTWTDIWHIYAVGTFS